MLRKHCLIIAALVLAFLSQELFAKGVKIVLHLNNGEQKRGELYSVSDSSLIVGWSEAGKESFVEIKLHEIRHVVVDKKPDLLLLLKNEQQMAGKLYAVTDSSLLVYGREIAKERGRSNFGKHISEIKNREVKLAMIRLKGSSHSLPGAGLGLLAGTVVGSVVATHFLTRHKDDPIEFFEDLTTSGWAAIAGPVGGAIAGGKIGAADSTPTKEAESSVVQPYSILKPLARYSEQR